jgi:hypothetical protein
MCLPRSHSNGHSTIFESASWLQAVPIVERGALPLRCTPLVQSVGQCVFFGDVQFGWEGYRSLFVA